MDKNYICKRCSAELVFYEMPPDFLHKWKAVCSECQSKSGETLFNKWVSNKVMKNIINCHSHARVYRREEAYKHNGAILMQRLEEARQRLCGKDNF